MVEAPRGFSLFPMVVSALCAILLARLAWESPRLLVPFLVVIVLVSLPAIMARRRMRQLLRSGDVHRILSAWAPSFERIVHPETMTPLLVATAYAACGFVESSRRALERAARGPAWDAAIEQRLVVETLLDTFEGDREASLDKAFTLLRLPMPSAGLFTRRKIARLRRGVAALARAFAHLTEHKDAAALRHAARSSPIVYWPMRYAEAIVAVDRGNAALATSILQAAPKWPQDSAFKSFHDQLEVQTKPRPS